MEYNNSSSASSNGALSQYLQHVYIKLLIVLLVTSIIPSLVVGSVVLHFLFRMMTRKEFTPITFVYTIISIFCVISPVGLAAFWLLTLYSNSLVPQNSTVSCTIYAAKFVMCYTPFMVVCYSIGITSIVQFLLLHTDYKRLVTLKSLALSMFAVSVASILFPFVLNLGLCVREQMKSHRDYSRDSLTEVGVAYVIVAYVLPLVIIVIFSVLTHLKVKREVSYRKKVIVRSVLLINGSNITIYCLFKIFAVVIYFVGVYVSNNLDVSTTWIEIARYLGDLGYLFTIASILILNPRLRSMALVCFKLKTGDLTLTDASRNPTKEETSTQSQRSNDNEEAI